MHSDLDGLLPQPMGISSPIWVKWQNIRVEPQMIFSLDSKVEAP